MIVAQALTNANIADAATGTELMEEVRPRIKTVIADDAYDTRAFYASVESRSARVVVPPDKTATVGGGLSRHRDRAVRRIGKVGRRQWKTEVGYHRQARVENAFFGSRQSSAIGCDREARERNASRQ